MLTCDNCIYQEEGDGEKCEDCVRNGEEVDHYRPDNYQIKPPPEKGCCG